jgi:hypothetical protein
VAVIGPAVEEWAAVVAPRIVGGPDGEAANELADADAAEAVASAADVVGDEAGFEVSSCLHSAEQAEQAATGPIEPVGPAAG